MIRFTSLMMAVCCLLSIPAFADEQETSHASTKEREHPPTRQYTFAWPYADQSKLKPRGGTTSGPDVKLSSKNSTAWQALTTPGLKKKDRDRQAILAMAGAYRASFDFLETTGFVADYLPKRPYQSWGTEYVYVVEDKTNFVSLQHIIVMLFQTEQGISEPMIVKHWRQDWHYEDREIHTYQGHNRWQLRKYKKRDVKGKWSQAVFQVDDSPRYEAMGKWTHFANYSSWQSEETWRPLPRREFSVRNDYQALVGTNRHTITPTGWVHEEDNLKVVLDKQAQYQGDTPVLAREVGLNRYERIEAFDFSAGDQYWARTKAFWADVRSAWDQVKDSNKEFTLKSKYEDRRLFAEMFAYAADIESAESYDSKQGKVFIDKTLNNFLGLAP